MKKRPVFHQSFQASKLQSAEGKKGGIVSASIRGCGTLSEKEVLLTRPAEKKEHSLIRQSDVRGGARKKGEQWCALRKSMPRDQATLISEKERRFYRQSSCPPRGRSKLIFLHRPEKKSPAPWSKQCLIAVKG